MTINIDDLPTLNLKLGDWRKQISLIQEAQRALGAGLNNIVIKAYGLNSPALFDQNIIDSTFTDKIMSLVLERYIEQAEKVSAEIEAMGVDMTPRPKASALGDNMSPGFDTPLPASVSDLLDEWGESDDEPPARAKGLGFNSDEDVERAAPSRP